MSFVEVREASVRMNGVAGGRHDSAPQRANEPPVRPHQRAKMNGDASHTPRDKKVKVRNVYLILASWKVYLILA